LATGKQDADKSLDKKADDAIEAEVTKKEKDQA